MEFDRREQKMLLAFIAVNLGALGIGLVAMIAFNLLAGLIGFTVSIIVLPLLLQKKILEKYSS